MKLNPTLLKATGVAALGGLLFGFDTAVIAGTTHSLTLTYSLSPRQLGLTVAMALIGTIIGAMSAGIPGQRWGGRETLRVLAIFYVLSALGALSPRIGTCCWWPASSVDSASAAPRYWAHVHRGTRAREIARPAGGIVPDQHRAGHLLAYFSNYLVGRLGLAPTNGAGSSACLRCPRCFSS